MVRENPLIPINERRCVAVIHGLKNGDDGLERIAYIYKEVEQPGARANTILKREGIFLEHWDEMCRVEGRLRVLETMGHITEHVDDCFIGSFSGVWVVGNSIVSLFDEVLPHSTNVCLIAMICRFEDDQTNVEVFPWICIFIEELIALLVMIKHGV